MAGEFRYKGSGPFTPGTVQVVAYTATAGTSNALAATTRLARVVCTTAAHIKIGANPTATTNDIYMPANVPEYFFIETAGSKISAIQVSAGGNLHICEMN